MCFARPNVPEMQPIQQPPRQQDQTVQDAGADAQRRQRARSGSQSTVLTSSGSTSAPVIQKRLLGQ